MTIVVDMKNSDIEKAGGVFLRQEEEYEPSLSCWVIIDIYLLNGKEVTSSMDWQGTCH